jgi:transposase
MQAKAVENQLLVDERNALHTQLLNSGASHKRFKTNVSAYISKKNGLIRDLQTQFSELASKTESRLLELESKVPLEYGGFSVLESKNKELTEQLLACTAAKGVSDTQLEECKAEKEDLTEQLAHTQSLLLQSITSIGKRKRSVFDASQ